MKNLLLTIICFSIFSNLSLTGQSFTRFEQAANDDSDYFINVDWEIDLGSTCSCVSTVNTFLNIKQWNGSEYITIESQSNPNIDPWTGSTQTTWHPGINVSYLGEIINSAAKNSLFIPCDFSCDYYNNNVQMMTTQPLKNITDLTIMRSDSGSVLFNWTVNTDIPNYNYKLEVYKNGSLYRLIFGKSITSWEDPCPSIGDEYGFRTKYEDTFLTYASTTSFNTKFFNQMVYDATPPPMGKISGKVETTNGSPVDSVLVEAILQNPSDLSNISCWPQYYSQYTDATGAYTIPFIYWGVNSDQAQYKVIPNLENHGFDPGEVTVTLQDGDFTKVVDFTDTTAFSIKGFVLDANGCGVDSASIRTTSGDFFSTFTKPNGSYDLIVPETGSYTLEAAVDTFDLGAQTIIVNADVQDKNFNYLETDTLNLYIGAGCFEFIGQAIFDIKTKGGCLLKTDTTNLSGFSEGIVLPKREITIEVVNINPPISSGLDANEIISDIGGEMPVDLDSTTTINIVYRKPLSLELFGIPAPPCPAVSDPVFQQSNTYPITIYVWESPGICLADTGYVLVQDNIAAVGLATNVLDTVPISRGIAQYNIFPGEPILNAPYLKNISFTAVVDSSSANKTINGIVSGSRQRTQTFVTGGPTELPYLILRDPPGDASYSFFNQNESVTYAESYSSKQSGDTRFWAKAKWKATAFPGIKIVGEVGGGIKVGGARTSNTEQKTTLSDFTGISTSSGQFDIGEDFDLVYGAAVNFIYGLVDERRFDLNTCSMIVDTALMFSPDTFETKFITTIRDIRENKIPTLELFSNNPDTTEEARVKFSRELNKWEQVIQLNEDLKTQALTNPIDNYSINGDAGPFQLSSTGSVTKSASIVTSQFINGDIALRAGVDILDETFVLEGGVEINIRSEWGQSQSRSITETTTTGFVFDDSGPRDDDEISFDYAIDPVYSTPVFGDPIGRTSCPHEMGTQFVDFPQIVALNPVQYADENETFLIFDLAIRNYSESNDTRLYNIRFEGDDGSARVSFGDSPLSTGDIIPRTLAAGEQQILKIKVEQNDPDVYSFEGLEFRMFPSCQTSLFSSTYINAYFENDCPFVSMPLPNSSFLINGASNHLMGVVMDDYILNPDIDHIKLQYLPIGSTQWMDSNVDIPGPNLIAPPQQYFWDATTIEDGEYSIRWELKCGNTLNVSPRVNGIIDRKAPRVFGREKPSDDTFFPGDEISVTFTEVIDILDLQNGNFYVTNLTTDTSVPATISADEKTVYIDLGINIDSLYNQSFQIGLIGVKDIYNNARPDTVLWDFLVSEPDSDRDGIGDLTDRCPGGDDCEDTDMDGVPDDCDCLPTIPQNGKVISKAAMDFDGFENQIIVLDDPLLNPIGNSFTFEAWVNAPDDILSQTILSKGNGSNAQTSYIFSIFQNKLALFIGNGSQSTWIYSDTDFSFDEWTHAAVKYDSNANQFTFYQNGKPDGVRTIPHGFYNSSGQPVFIGRQGSSCNCNFYKGQMDEVRIWNSARTESELNNNKNKELSGSEMNLVAYYDFNEGIPFGDNNGQSIVKDNSPNGFDGGIINLTKIGTSSNWVYSPQASLNAQYELCLTCPDTINAAIDLDGINDKLFISNNAKIVPTTSNEMTIELWMNPVITDPGNTDIIASIEGNLYLTRQSTSLQLFTNTFTFASIDISANLWTHMAFVFKTDSLEVYKNGIKEFAAPFTHQAVNSGNPIYIGSYNVDNQYHLDGRMDDLRFWDYARTEAEIQADMFHEMLGTEIGLEAYFDFNEGIASGDNKVSTFAEDKTGNGNHISFENMNQFGGYSNYVPSALNFRIDEDEDGRPDACDSCIPQPSLTLENTVLSGTYIAKDKITLGAGLTIPVADTIFLRAPEIEVLHSISSPSSTRIYVKNKPCDE